MKSKSKPRNFKGKEGEHRLKKGLTKLRVGREGETLYQDENPYLRKVPVAMNFGAVSTNKTFHEHCRVQEKGRV